MKILYGVQGTGNGHISRAREMARAFKQLGAEVDFYFSGRASEHYFDMDCFGHYQSSAGLTFVSENGQVERWKTVIQSQPSQFLSDVKGCDLRHYDVVLNDFEPITAWAAKQQKVHSIGISHQCAFLHAIPKVNESWFDRGVTRYFAPTSQQLGLHWHHFGQMILPPIVPSITQLQITNDGSVLVYLPFENVAQVQALLSRFNHVKFYCYHPCIESDFDDENICFRRLSRKGFHHRLHQCAGVIANGGFELPSEAIGLGKKLLLKPLQGQYEQQSNVAMLELMGLAQSMDNLTPASLHRWLETYSVGQVIFPDVALHIARWVLEGEWYHCDELWKHLWRQVVFPDVVSENMTENYPLTWNSHCSLLITDTY
ncbi:MJ1255/VC2487 family glycosyltransferase [Photobacterium profundum]|uniref:MJ1255/VC2487 family glycosyltransferase n=1 Tax=Photobacterium profundum TaxID=74109 RepID=UPI003D0D1EE0